MCITRSNQVSSTRLCRRREEEDWWEKDEVFRLPATMSSAPPPARKRSSHEPQPQPSQHPPQSAPRQQTPGSESGCYLFFRLQSRPSIQALGALCFIANALLLLLLFFILVNPEEAAMYMKLSIIRTNVREMSLIPVPFVVSTCISIMIDLFLVVGIEDNCRQALTTFINWGSLCMTFEIISWLGIIAFKVNRLNITMHQPRPPKVPGDFDNSNHACGLTAFQL